MKILVFEDNKTANLSPVTLLRATFEIKAGIYTILEKITKISEQNCEIFLNARDILTDVLKEKYTLPVNENKSGDYLFINGKINFTRKAFKEIILTLEENTVLISGDSVIAAKPGKNLAEKVFQNARNNNNIFCTEDFSSLSKKEVKTEDGIFAFEYPWDLVKYTKEILTDDLKIYFNEHLSEVFTPSSNSVLSPDNILVSPSSKLYPNVVLDASSGDIAIDENAVIEPFTFVKGPVYIGKNVIVKAGTKIYGPCSIGIHSRVAGEISGTVFHGYSNKQHDGFIGNSYVCEFVNLGADTVTSNLKNNYSKIKSRFSSGDRQYHTNMQFFGTVFGDHTKTGINTMLNTGSIIGIFTIIAGGGFPDKFIDSFTWYISGKLPAKYKISEALETARVVMSRRDVELTSAYEELVREVYKSFLTESIV